jgi:hypothetical protein
MSTAYKDFPIKQVATDIPVLVVGENTYIALDLTGSVWTVEESGEGEYTATVTIGAFTLTLTADVAEQDGVTTISNLVYTAVIDNGGS